MTDSPGWLGKMIIYLKPTQKILESSLKTSISCTPQDLLSVPSPKGEFSKTFDMVPHASYKRN